MRVPSPMKDPAPESSPLQAAVRPTVPGWREALAFWFKLGFIGFGGPAGQIALMHHELVERRRWLSERRFQHALNYCMVLPGPEAQQLATYLGWLMHRTWGGIAAGALFVLPSLGIMVALAWAYLRFGDVAWVAGVFDGLQAAVVALVLHAAHRMGRRTLRNRWLWGVAMGAFVAVAVARLPFPAIVLAAGLIGHWGGRWAPAAFAPGGGPAAHSAHHGPALIDDNTPPPVHARFSRRRLAVVLAWGLGLWAVALGALVGWQGWHSTLAQMGWFFTKAAWLTFGGAYAVLPYVHQGAVDHFQWLTAPQMMAGLALGETTPGPLIMVVAFVGFVGAWGQQVLGPDALLSGAVLGACVVTYFTFLPSFIFILAGGPLVESTHGRLGFTAPLTAIGAAVVGVILDLALYFAHHVLWPAGWRGPFDAASAVILLGAALALWRFRWGVVPTIAACAAAGGAWRVLGPVWG